MEEDIKIRIGNIQDVHQVMEIAIEMHKEIGITDFDAQKFLKELYPALCLEKGIVGIIDGPDGIVEGGVLLRVGQLFYSTEEVLEDRGVFVRPELRSAKGGRARKLIEFCKKVADELNLTLIAGIQNDVRTQGKIKLYERQFGEPIGALFMYKPGGKPPVEGEG